MTSKKTSSWLGYLAVAGITAVFVVGIVAGRFLAAYPMKRALGYWDLARSLGTMADDNKDHALRAAAYLDPERTQANMHSYSWVLRNSPAPFLGTITAQTDELGVHISPRGFRAAGDPEMPKPEGRIRVFLTGGSTAFSVGAPDEDSTIAGFLQRELNDARVASSTVAYEVITYANPSWASTHERIAIENVLRHYDPDLVISFSGTNDAVWAQLGRDVHFFRTHYEQTYFTVVDAAARLAGRGPVPDPTQTLDGSVPPAQAVERLLQNVRTAHFVLQEGHVPYLFALQPTLYAASNPTEREKGLLSKQDPKKVDYFARMYPEIARSVGAFEAPGFTFVDLSDVFSSAEGQEVFLDAYHFGDRGNQLIAKALARAIRQAKLL